MKRSHSVVWAVIIALAGFGAAGRLMAQNLNVNPTSLSFTSQNWEVPNPQTISIQTSTGTPLSYTITYSVTSTVAWWLQVAPTSGTTPGSAMVWALPTGLSQGTHNGTIRISAQGAANSPVEIPVSFTIGGPSPLTVSPASLPFTYVMGGLTPASQTLTVGTLTGASLAFTATATTASGVNWLTVSPASGIAPNASVAVGLNPIALPGLTPGPYNGTVTLAPPTGAGPSLQVSVILTVSSAPALTLTPNVLSFYYQTGTTPPSQQVLSITTPGATIGFSLTVTSNNNWLVAVPMAGATPSDIAVGVSSAVLAALGPGYYSGAINVNAPGASNSPQTVQVNLTVSNLPLLTANPTSLTFDMQPGGTTPASKTVSLGSSGAQISFSVSTTTTTPGVNWLTASPATGTTASTVTVGIGPGAMTLAPGNYSGSVVVSSLGAGNSLTIQVALNVSSVPVLSISPASLAFNFQTGKSTPAIQTVDLKSTGTPISFTASATSTGNWLLIGQNTGVTPATLTVEVNPANRALGNHQGTITITPALTGVSAQTITVNLTVSDKPLLNVSHNKLSFTFAPGGTTVQIEPNLGLTSTSDPLKFDVTAATTTGPPGWLLVTPSGGTTPTNVTVIVTAGNLTPGIYTGSITATATTGGANTITIPVTVTVTTGNNLEVEPSSLSFTQAQGGPAPEAKTLSIKSSGVVLNFSATATSGVGNWLAVAPATGSTPGTLSVSVNAGSLGQGPYDGTITIVAAGASNSPQSVSVRLTVGPPQSLSVNPASLAFNWQVGTGAPAAQKIAVTSTGGSLNFTASATGGNWLSVSPASGTTSGEVTVSVNPSGLTAGPYNGTVTIASTAASNSPQTVRVTLTVVAAATPLPTVVANAASYAPGAVAPGEIITIGGTNLSAVTPAEFRPPAPGGIVETTLANTRLLFDGIAAPLLYVSATQINAIVPYEVAGRLSTRMVIEYLGVRSESIELRVADTAPAIFAMDASGRGQGAILNQDYSRNGPSNRADKRSIVMVYATGEGQTDPPGLTGLVPTVTQLREPRRDVTATIGGRPATVKYSGSAPNLVSGLLQVNVEVPDDAPSGNAVPVVLTIGGVSSPSNITMAVR